MTRPLQCPCNAAWHHYNRIKSCALIRIHVDQNGAHILSTFLPVWGIFWALWYDWQYIACKGIDIGSKFDKYDTLFGGGNMKHTANEINVTIAQFGAC